MKIALCSHWQRFVDDKDPVADGVSFHQSLEHFKTYVREERLRQQETVVGTGYSCPVGSLTDILVQDARHAEMIAKGGNLRLSQEELTRCPPS